MGHPPREESPTDASSDCPPPLQPATSSNNMATPFESSPALERCVRFAQHYGNVLGKKGGIWAAACSRRRHRWPRCVRRSKQSARGARRAFIRPRVGLFYLWPRTADLRCLDLLFSEDFYPRGSLFCGTPDIDLFSSLSPPSCTHWFVGGWATSPTSEQLQAQSPKMQTY